MDAPSAEREASSGGRTSGRGFPPLSGRKLIRRKRRGMQIQTTVGPIELEGVYGWMIRERGAQWGLKPLEQPADRVWWHEV